MDRFRLRRLTSRWRWRSWTASHTGSRQLFCRRTARPRFGELLGTSLAVELGLVTKESNEHLNLLDSNDDRMNQTIYLNGQVWGALNTVVKGPTGPTRTAIAWFVVEPEWIGDVLSGSVANEGYLAVQNNSVMFPAVAANAAGDGIITFSLAGPGVYPSAAYVTLDPGSGTGPVQVVRQGAGPADGFTGYNSLGGSRVERWGDYSAAVADPAGAIWFATRIHRLGLRPGRVHCHRLRLQRSQPHGLRQLGDLDNSRLTLTSVAPVDTL